MQYAGKSITYGNKLVSELRQIENQEFVETQNLATSSWSVLKVTPCY
jgi:hypothetical protein